VPRVTVAQAGSNRLAATTPLSILIFFTWYPRNN
jgi:hypothetical protein